LRRKASGLYRQATRRSGDIDPGKRAAVTRILGTHAWEQELYSDMGQGDMFGGREKQRTADVRGLERYVKARLETIFAKVFEAKALPVDQKPQRFSRSSSAFRIPSPRRWVWPPG
jgi:hypothetical protein